MAGPRNTPRREIETLSELFALIREARSPGRHRRDDRRRAALNLVRPSAGGSMLEPGFEPRRVRPTTTLERVATNLCRRQTEQHAWWILLYRSLATGRRELLFGAQ